MRSGTVSSTLFHSLDRITGCAKACTLCMQRKVKALSGRGRRTTFMCKQCNLPLCRTGCFLEYHQARNVDVENADNRTSRRSMATVKVEPDVDNGTGDCNQVKSVTLPGISCKCEVLDHQNAAVKGESDGDAATSGFCVKREPDPLDIGVKAEHELGDVTEECDPGLEILSMPSFYDGELPEVEYKDISAELCVPVVGTDDQTCGSGTEDKRRYLCDVCNKAFTRLFNLKTHMHIHTGERPYSCDTCNKSFSHAGSLKNHMHVHTEERRYSCDTCNKSFSRLDNLKKHQYIHRSERRYSCDTCSKSFSHSENLKKHRLVHSGERAHSCDICKKSFSQKFVLKRHMHKHTGERPYSCDICQKRFFHLGNVKKHRRIHTGERLYSCEICSKSFTQNITLKKHYDTHRAKHPYQCGVQHIHCALT